MNKTYLAALCCIALCSCKTTEPVSQSDLLFDTQKMQEYNRFLNVSSHAIFRKTLTVVFDIGGGRMDSRQYIAFRNVEGPLTVFDGRRFIEIKGNDVDATYIADQVRTGVLFAWYED